MDPAVWIAAAAAVGASGLTAAASLGVVYVQARQSSRAADRAQFESSVLALLARSFDLAVRSRAAGETMKLRSGLAEGFDVTMGKRKPLDPMEFHDWIARDMRPLNEAWAQVWLCGDPVTVRLSDQVVFAGAELLGVSTARQSASSGPERLRRLLLGEKWTAEMLDAHQNALEELGRARKALAEHVRDHLGRDVLDVAGEPR